MSYYVKRTDSNHCQILEALASCGCDEKGDARWLILTGDRTKASEPRVMAIGPRLRAELAMRRDGPDGEPLPLSAHVFDNDIGEPLTSIRE